MSVVTIAPAVGSRDPTAHADLVEVALTAFAHDVSYAVNMARAAGVIRHKRAVWAARKQRPSVDDCVAA